MAKTALSPESIERLVEHMFEEVLNDSERADLLRWIHVWEAENPGVDAANRVTGWIDVAYAFQSRKDAMSRPSVESFRTPYAARGLAAAFG